MNAVAKISFWKAVDCIHSPKGCLSALLSEALENTNKGIWFSGITAHVHFYELSLQLWWEFFLLLFSSVTVRPWETERCSGDQSLTRALGPAKRAMWPTCFLLLHMALGLCLTLVVVFYPLSRHCLLWALKLESWVFIPVWLFDIQDLLFNRKHLPLAWTRPPLLSSMVSWLPELWPVVFLTPPA